MEIKFLKAASFVAFIAIICCICPNRGFPEDMNTLSIAAAADLAPCMEKLDAEFKKTHPSADLKVSTGSSGNFFAQIQNGAPFDIFMSADAKYPRDLAAGSFADGKSLTVYAAGTLVLWTALPDLDPSKGLEMLLDRRVKRVSIANPEHAPYGRAAKAALEGAHLWEAVKSKLVLGENISQAAQFVRTGNAEAGLVALSLVLVPGGKGFGRYKEVPRELYPPLEQAAIITKHGLANPLASEYIELLRSEAARSIFKEYGFGPPAGTK